VGRGTKLWGGGLGRGRGGGGIERTWKYRQARREAPAQAQLQPIEQTPIVGDHVCVALGVVHWT